MRQIWLLTSANLKKNKGQAVSFFLLILLSAILLNIGLIVSLRYDNNFDQRAEEAESADVITTIQDMGDGYLEDYKKELLEDNRTTGLEIRPVLFLAGSSQYGGSETARLYAVMNEAEKQEYGKIKYIEKTAQSVESPVYLPWLYKTGGGYGLGDIFKLKISSSQGKEETFTYTVAGFFEEPLLATINSTTTGLILETEEYQELSRNFSGNLDGSMFLVKLKDSSANEPYCTAHLPVPPDRNALSDSVFYDVIKRSRTVTSTIGALLIVAFSMIIVGITLIVVRFRIGNNIEEDMPNIGAQKAIGYTSRQIRNSILLQFLSVGFAGILTGIGFSYILLPYVTRMFAAQTGVIWNPGFDPLSALITAAFHLTAVTAVSLISARKIHALSPIVALRTGIVTHSFRKNYFPLDTRKGNILFLLAGKNVFQNLRQNVLVGTIIAAIGFVSVFSGVLYYNIAMKFDNFMVSTAGEIYSAQITCSSSEAAEEIRADLADMAEVRKAFSVFTDSAQSKNNYQVMCYATEDYSLYDNQDMIYEGRFPKHDNETALGGLLAGKLDKKPGNTIVMQRGAYQAEYLITGLVQGSNYMGHDAALTDAGYRHLAPEYQPTVLAVYLKDGQNTEKFMEHMKELYTDKIISTYDNKEIIKASLGSYQDIVAAIVVAIAFITAAIVALTLYLIIKTSILRKKRELGIQKAIGYTTVQLIIQTAVSFLPVVLLGTLLGNTAGYWGVNPLLSILFSGIGIMKVNYEIPIIMIAGLCAGITLFGFGISVLVAARIRKISPYALMTE